jgi:biopolymer transport protein ExbB/TolQ
MKELFFLGGAGFMSILTILLIVVVSFFVYYLVLALGKQDNQTNKIKMRLSYIRSIGLFAMITGILGQLIGLYMAFSHIEMAGDISPGIFYGGIKVSMVTTLYGIVIYLISIVLWFILSLTLTKKMNT